MKEQSNFNMRELKHVELIYYNLLKSSFQGTKNNNNKENRKLKMVVATSNNFFIVSN